MKRLGKEPNFTSYHGVFESANSIYMLMEYVKGEPIFDIMDFRRFKEIKRARILDQLATAIEAMHKNNVVHRDFKPENILLTPQGTIKVIDYGLSLITEGPSIQVSRAGSPGFLAPELLQTKNVVTGQYCSKTDIYSLGIIHYCMITGDHPFMADTSSGVLNLNLHSKIDLNNQHVTYASQEEQDLLASMLADTKEARINIEDLVLEARLLLA